MTSTNNYYERDIWLKILKGGLQRLQAHLKSITDWLNSELANQ